MNADDPINKIFGDDPPNLYTVLGLKQDSHPSSSEIKKSYHRQALENHPDKNPSKDASEKFQKVSFAYTVLSDDKKRDKYDKTGKTSDLGVDIGDDYSWEDYFNDLFERVTWEALAEDRINYQGSQDELQDLKHAYEECEGDLDAIFTQIPHASVLDDEERFIEILHKEIKEGSLSSTKKFDKSTKPVARKSRAKKAESEAEQAAELRHELGLGSDFEEISGEEGDEDDSALAKLIAERGDKRQNELDDLVSSLEAKYAPAKKGKSKGKEKEAPDNKKKRVVEDEEEEEEGDEPTEEEFQKAQEKLSKKTTKPNKKQKS